MTKNCRFCELIKKQDCSKIFENKFIFAFMDKAPVNKGHILVIPKQHISNFEDLDNKIYTKLMLFTKKVSKIIKKITKCKKVGILIAGFDVPHTHIHIVPMFNKTDVCTKRVSEQKFVIASSQELSEIANKILNQLSL